MGGRDQAAHYGASRSQVENQSLYQITAECEEILIQA